MATRMTSASPPAYDDDPLWHSALHNDDQQAFRALVARHVRWVTAIIACHCQDHCVSDLGSAVFQQAWRSLQDLHRQSRISFAHWLLQVTRQECTSYLHRHPNNRRTAPELDSDDWMVPERIAQAALMRLPSAQRELIAAAQDGQQDYDQLSCIFRLRRSALARQLLQARQALAREHGQLQQTLRSENT